MNTTRVFYTEGSRDLAEGLTIGFYTVDEEGNVVAGSTDGFMRKEVTEKQYMKLRDEINSGEAALGLARGLVNKKGLAAIEKKFKALAERQNFQIAGQLALGRFGSDEEYEEAINTRIGYLEKQIASMGLEGDEIKQHLMNEPILIEQRMLEG